MPKKSKMKKHSFNSTEEWRSYTLSVYEPINEMMKMLEEYNQEMLDSYKNPFERMQVYLSDEARENRKYITEYWLEAREHFNMANRKEEDA